MEGKEEERRRPSMVGLLSGMVAVDSSGGERVREADKGSDITPEVKTLSTQGRSMFVSDTT
jgi:hypothetical protein